MTNQGLKETVRLGEPRGLHRTSRNHDRSWQACRVPSRRREVIRASGDVGERAYTQKDVDPVSILAYIHQTVFKWDSDKSDRNLPDRGFDFEFATMVFEGPTLERDDLRRDYGERRLIAIGVADGIPLTLVYTDRAENGRFVRRIISARQSNRHEREAYTQANQSH